MRNLLKIIAVILAFSMLLTTGCLNKPKTEDLPEEWSEEENSVEQQNILLPDPTAEHEEPAPAEPGIEARIRFSGIGAVYKYAARGEQLQITGLEDGFFTAEVDGIPVLADSRLIRLSSEAAWQEKVLYAQRSAAVSSGPYVYSEKQYTLSVNQRVTVLDSLGELALVEKDGRSGYLLMKDIGPAI